MQVSASSILFFEIPSAKQDLQNLFLIHFENSELFPFCNV